MKNVFPLFPAKIQNHLQSAISNSDSPLEEIRLRVNQPIELSFVANRLLLEDCIFCLSDSVYVLRQISEHSLYRLHQELHDGYITIRGGHRVGLAGSTIMENGQLKQLNQITFLNIRIAHDLQHIANPIMATLYDNNQINHTLIIGAPQTGKTTLLRDIARKLSDGYKYYPSKKVCIVDERSEIAAAKDGVPQHQIGRRTDVLDACPKATGMMMMIRTMSPDVIIVDEIGTRQDVEAIHEAILSGVSVICSIHGTSLIDISKRPMMQSLLREHLFSKAIILDREPNRFMMTPISFQETRSSQ